MRKSKDELNRIHKEKCKELKEVRAKIAEDLGIDLHQKDCTYEGYCSGTCPKCMQEEVQLNTAIMKKQLEEADLKRRVATVGLSTVAALALTGCNTTAKGEVAEGVMPYIPYEQESMGVSPELLEGDVVYIPSEEEESNTVTEEILEGETECPPPDETEESEQEEILMGEILYYEEESSVQEEQ